MSRLCQRVDTMKHIAALPTADAATAGPRMVPRCRRLAGGALFAVLGFGALVQSGVIAPALRPGTPEGGGGGRFFLSVDNESWRAFDIAGVRFSGGGTSVSLPRGGMVTLALYPTPERASGSAGAVPSLTVGADRSFGVGVTLRWPGCTASLGGTYVRRLPIEFEVSTPLGSRAVVASITVECLGAVFWSTGTGPP